MGSAWQLIKTKEEDGELQFFIIFTRRSGIVSHNEKPTWNLEKL